MRSNRRRLSRSSNKDWEVQQVGTNEMHYLITERGSISVAARRNANAFWWEAPKEPQASLVMNPGDEPESSELALWKTTFFLHWAYQR